MSDRPFLYPSVTSLPGQSGVDPNRPPGLKPGQKGEFDKVFEGELTKGIQPQQPDLGAVKQPLKFSAHATQRLRDRNIILDQPTMGRISDAIDKADAKGVEDTLVLTKDAALIVSVKNRTVITALDRNSLNGNVFTNIDGAVIV